MSETSGLTGIWEDIRNYLVVSTEVVEEATTKNGVPLIVKFTVTNTAQSQDEQPEILFEEVILKVGMSLDWHYERTTNLAEGQSFQYQYRCRYSELQKVQYSVEGKLSPMSLLQVRKRIGTVSARRQTLTVGSYVCFLKEVNIYKWIDEFFKKFKIPGSETTIADLEVQKATLNKTSQEIQEVTNNLQWIIMFIKKDDNILQHKRLVDEYLKRTLEGCGRLHNLLSTPSRGRELASERDSIITRLTTEAARINQATAELIKSK